MHHEVRYTHALTPMVNASTHSFPLGWVVPPTPLALGESPTRVFFAHLPTGSGARLLPVLSVPFPGLIWWTLANSPSPTPTTTCREPSARPSSTWGWHVCWILKVSLAWPSQDFVFGVPNPDSILNPIPPYPNTIPKPKVIPNLSSLPALSPSSSSILPPSCPQVPYLLHHHLKSQPTSISVSNLSPSLSITPSSIICPQTYPFCLCNPSPSPIANTIANTVPSLSSNPFPTFPPSPS